MKKVLGVLGFLFLASLAIVLCVAAAYWNGEGLRSYLSRAVAEGIGVEGRFSPLRLRGLAVGSGGFSGEGVPGSPIGELRAEDLEARFALSAVAHGIWRIDPLRIAHLEIVFRAARREGEPTSDGSRPSGPPEAPGAGRARAGFGRMSLERGEIQRVDLRWPASILGGGALSGTRVSLKAEGSAWNGKAGGGTIACASLPNLSLEELRFRLDTGGLSLEQGRLRSEPSGSILLAGRFRWRDPGEGELRFSASGVALSPWLPEAWRNRVEGDLEAEGTVAAPRRGPWKVEADLSLAHGKLEGLPWLVELALNGGGAAALPLDRARAHLQAEPGDLSFERIEIESRGRMRIEGSLQVRGDSLSGHLAVGLAPERVALLPSAREKIFSEEKGGYLWAPVTVTGTVRDPQEDLSPRITAVAKEAVKAGVERTIRSALDFLRRSRGSPGP
ncbi:conserved protein of unknown function [Methylacidimicrobium sp. AP8]|uniref:hypothetical protein n=1 Tax=Methylacidimicrobium sp. AP8 TaxID=2730359 RepID=UPI0018C1A461|nr:hypothetical protein [Methylacidimicrobium sp. AP8]CAB4242621.1 conserved protein of unknown function [Methylacidimicrobium sp. AP8]